MWSTATQSLPQEATYFLILASENVVLYANDLETCQIPLEHLGDFNSFKSYQIGEGAAYIPLDTHTALTLGWVDMDRMVRNRPYLDETIKAAIALVA